MLIKNRGNIMRKRKKRISKKYKKQEPHMPKKQKDLDQIIHDIIKQFDLDTLYLKEPDKLSYILYVLWVKYHSKEYLSFDQIIYMISLMYSINTEETRIEDSLYTLIDDFLAYSHPYAAYNQAYDRFAYLGRENHEVQEHLDKIEEILSAKSIFICDDEEYTSTKEQIALELWQIERITKGNYTFEKEEAKKLLNTNKE